MGAFNWIDFKSTCPCCGTEQCIHAQTHIASDYGGVGTTRFHDAVYKLGAKMDWWEPSHPNYDSWKNGNRKELINTPENEDFECCYANCSSCKAELYVIIKFNDCSPIQIVEIGVEESWPEFYLK